MGEAAGKVAAGKRVVYASRPYPTLIEKEDAYQPTVKPLDITLKSIVKSGNVDDKDVYQPTIKPLDITLKRVVVSSNVDGDAYQPTVKPLDITLKTV